MAETTDEKDSSGYSPYLAQLLKINPEQITNVSLSALGRQALGADSEAYQKAKAEVDAAREAMRSALENRKSTLDPSMLALAQGFLAPTRTGSFGESLGSAVGRYQEAQRAEQDRAAQIAKMRYELANAALGEEKEAAKLGLQVAQKLTPSLTAYQKQVAAEGIDPRSPAGIARVKELLALDKATPEMKEFAARAGIAITDPTFPARFKAAQAQKPLQDVATRLGLDLSDPAQLARAQAEAQREAFAKQNPDLYKKLQQFGGDPLDPKALARAQAEIQHDVALDRAKKSADLASTRATTTRTNQEIMDHIRLGNTQAIQQTAQRTGVPLDPNINYAGLNPKEVAAKRSKDQDEAEKYIRDKVTPYLTEVDNDLNNLNRALQLNREIRTGFRYGVGFGVGEASKLLSGDRAKFNELDSLAALAAKANRIPGDSNVSNADLNFMRLGSFSTDKEPSTNENIITFLIAQRQRDKDLQTYLTRFAAVNGGITPYAMQQWRKYLDANPITIRTRVNEQGKPVGPEDKTGRERLIINPSRMSYEQYFSMPRVQVDAQGREVRQ